MVVPCESLTNKSLKMHMGRWRVKYDLAVLSKKLWCLKELSKLVRIVRKCLNCMLNPLPYRADSSINDDNIFLMFFNLFPLFNCNLMLMKTSGIKLSLLFLLLILKPNNVLIWLLRDACQSSHSTINKVNLTSSQSLTACLCITVSTGQAAD